jgi:hypothetical protein
VEAIVRNRGTSVALNAIAPLQESPEFRLNQPAPHRTNDDPGPAVRDDRFLKG